MAEPNDPTPTEAQAATPAPSAPEPVQAKNGTVAEPATNGEAPAAQGQAAPVDETFTNVDPKSLTQNDRAAYENMLRDYKRKTAEIAEIRRKAEAFDAWQKEQQAAQQGITDDEYVRAFDSKDSFQQFLQKAADPIVQKLNKTEEELRATKADLFLKDFKARHPDFDELDSDGLITGYVQINRPKSEAEWDARMSEAYNYAKKVAGKYEERGYKRGITRVEQKASQSTELPSGSPGQVYAGGDPTKITAKEAVELAMRGIRVPRS